MIEFLSLSSAPPPAHYQTTGETPLLQDAFREACARYATGITVATVTDSDGRPHGLTANSFSSVSWNPPMVLVCVDHGASAHDRFFAANSFAINILSDRQRDLSIRFAGPADERFEGLDWHPGPETGAPLLPGVLAWLECQTTHRVEAGDHTVFIGEVKGAGGAGEAQPLVYFLRQYRLLQL
jgi:flavin reductase (DIM6/NTAB) family NADH-FMN oxidoreductase RutF